MQRLDPGPVIQSAVNFSEGRRPEVIRAILRAVEDVPKAILADWSSDADHNRMVVTILGGPESIRMAVLAAGRIAVESIDLPQHKGVHPRHGAVDVVPIVPIREITMEQCVALSHQIADDLGRELKIPIYFYGESAKPGSRSALPAIRRAGRGVLGTTLFGGLEPDAGPRRVHPTAGVTMVGARAPLAAYNINLKAQSAEPATAIALEIRADREKLPELEGVRALGWWLESREIAQVSMNVTMPDRTPLPAIFDYVRTRAELFGVRELWSEVVGLIPRACLGGAPPARIVWRDFKETQILEYWMDHAVT